MDRVSGLEKVAEGVYLLRGDIKKEMNFYFIEGPDYEVVQVEAGIKPTSETLVPQPAWAWDYVKTKGPAPEAAAARF